MVIKKQMSKLFQIKGFDGDKKIRIGGIRGCAVYIFF